MQFQIIQQAYRQAGYFRLCKLNIALLDLLTAISPKLNTASLQSLLIGNIITSVLNNQPTPFQISIGALMGDHKGLINELSKYNVSCSDDETRRFRRSAAVHASKDSLLPGISDSWTDGLVQNMIDNFDAEISSQNCCLQCHYMVMLATQCKADLNLLDWINAESSIPRLEKEDKKNPIDCNTPITCYTDPMKPLMPPAATFMQDMANEHVAAQEVALGRARDFDFSFVKDILFEENIPEYNGYNTRICWESGMSPSPKSVLLYLPLINMGPSDPATVLTCITRDLKWPAVQIKISLSWQPMQQFSRL